MLVGVSPPLVPARRRWRRRTARSADLCDYQAAALKHNVGAALTQQVQLKKGGAQTRAAIGIWGSLKARSSLTPYYRHTSL